FSIPRIALIGVGEDETNVFEICASGLEFELVQRTYDTTLTGSIHSLYLQDSTHRTPHLTCVLQSVREEEYLCRVHHPKGHKEESEDDLLRVRLFIVDGKRVGSNEPHSFSVQLNNIYLYMDQERMTYICSSSAPILKTLREFLPHKEVSGTEEVRTTEDTSLDDIDLTGQFVCVVNSIHIQLANRGTTIAYLSLSDLKTLGQKYQGAKARAQASLRELIVKDTNCTHGSHGNALFIPEGKLEGNMMDLMRPLNLSLEAKFITDVQQWCTSIYNEAKKSFGGSDKKNLAPPTQKVLVRSSSQRKIIDATRFPVELDIEISPVRVTYRARNCLESAYNCVVLNLGRLRAQGGPNFTMLIDGTSLVLQTDDQRTSPVIDNLQLAFSVEFSGAKRKITVQLSQLDIHNYMSHYPIVHSIIRDFYPILSSLIRYDTPTDPHPTPATPPDLRDVQILFHWTGIEYKLIDPTEKNVLNVRVRNIQVFARFYDIMTLDASLSDFIIEDGRREVREDRKTILCRRGQEEGRTMMRLHVKGQDWKPQIISIQLDGVHVNVYPLFVVEMVDCLQFTRQKWRETLAVLRPFSAPTVEKWQVVDEPKTSGFSVDSLEIRLDIVGFNLRVGDASTNNSTSLLSVSFSTFAKLFYHHGASDFRLYLKQFDIYTGCQEEGISWIVPGMDASVEIERGYTSTKFRAVTQTTLLNFSWQDYMLIHRVIMGLNKMKEEIFKLIQSTTPKRKEEVVQDSDTNFLQEELDRLSISLECEGIQLTLYNDYREPHYPFMELQLQQLSLGTTPGDLVEISLSTLVRARYYSNSHAVWQPLVEHLPISIRMNLKERKPTHVRIVSDREGSDPLGIGREGCDVIVSKDFITTITSALDNLKEATGQVKSNKDWMYLHRNHNENASVLLCNDTGTDMHYWLCHNASHHSSLHESNGENQEGHGNLRRYQLGPGEERKIQIDRLNDRWRNSGRAPVNRGEDLGSLCVELTPYCCIHGLTLSRMGSYYLTMHMSPSHHKDQLEGRKFSESVGVVYSMGYYMGGKRFVVRSNVMIKNNTTFPMNISIHRQPSVTIDVGQSYAVPIDCLKSKFSVRPSRGTDTDENLSWSDSCHLLSESSDNHSQLLECKSNDDDTTSNSFWYNAFLEHLPGNGGKGEYVITLNAPLTLSNLTCQDLQFQIAEAGKNQSTVQGTLSPGTHEPIHFVDISSREMEETNGPLIKVSIPGYDWSNLAPITHHNKNRRLKMFDQNNQALCLECEEGENLAGTASIVRLMIYCKYWMINQTGLVVQYRSALEDPTPSLPSPSEEKFTELSDDPSDWYNERRTSQLSHPLMFSYSSPHMFESKTCIRVENSTWSKGITLDSPGMIGYLEISDRRRSNKKEDRLYQLGVRIDLAPSQFFRTKIVTISPRFILVNNTQLNLHYRQKGEEGNHSLPPHHEIPWHWTNRDGSREICIRLNGSEWSAGFSLDQLDDFAIKIPFGEKSSPYLARVQLQFERAIFFVVIHPESKEFPPYRIENMTPMSLVVYQRVVGAPERIDPYQAISYTWDEPSRFHGLVVEVINGDFKKDYTLDVIKSHKPVNIQFNRANGQKSTVRLIVDIVANGPTRTMRLIDGNTHNGLMPPHQREGGNKQVVPIGKVDGGDLEISVSVGRLYVSIVDAVPQELMLISLQGLKVRYSSSDSDHNVEFTLDQLEVDNQLYGTPFPKLLVGRANLDNTSSPHFMHMSLVKSKKYTSIDFFQYFSILFQEVSIKLEENFLTCLFNLASSVQTKRVTEQSGELEKYLTGNDTLLWNRNRGNKLTPYGEKKMYFQILHFNPIKVNLSYAGGNTNYGVGHQKGSHSNQPHNLPNSILKTIMNAVGVTLANLDGACITLNGLFLEHPFSTREQLLNRMSKHYSMQAVRELYKVVGSFDVLGNPVSLVSNLGTGVYDFFYEPAQGLVRSPEDFAHGLAKGTKSLVKRSVSSVFMTASKISGSLGKGLAALSMDDDYVREREMRRRIKPNHLGEGIAVGIRELGLSLYNGVSGVVNEPLVGVRDEGGVSGLIRGVSRAVLGLTIKPTVGLIDLATRTSQAISHTTSNMDHIPEYRCRAPRLILADRITEEYSHKKAYGQALVITIENGRYRGNLYVSHHVVGKYILLITMQCILCLRKGGAQGPTQTRWSIDIPRIRDVEKTRDSITFHLNVERSASKDDTLGMGVSNRRIHTSNSQLLEDIYGNIVHTIHLNRIKS
ncbi:vacuolar protein sorting-associated protein 13 family protein, partial [Planoprotostelium fungivorum]